MSELAHRRCKPCEGGVPALATSEAHELLARLDGWTLNVGGTEIVRTFRFKDFHETMEFVNAVAWIAHREDHHPSMSVGYDQCRVGYRTHAIDGLSENDFICAAKVSALID